MVARLRQFDGEVYVPNHGYLASMAGRKPYAHWMAVIDALRSNQPQAATRLWSEIDAALARQKFAAVVLDAGDQLNHTAFPNTYARLGTLFGDSTVFETRSGTPTRPRHLFVPALAERRAEPAQHPPR